MTVVNAVLDFLSGGGGDDEDNKVEKEKNNNKNNGVGSIRSENGPEWWEGNLASGFRTIGHPFEIWSIRKPDLLGVSKV